MGLLPPAATRVRDVPCENDFEADYHDCFRTPTSTQRPARDWAEVCLRGAESAHGIFGRLAWQGWLGLDLAPRKSPGTLVGWRISRDTDEEFVLDSEGSRLVARLTFLRADQTVEWATMLRFQHPLAAPSWAVAGPVHRLLVPRLLGRAGVSLG